MEDWSELLPELVLEIAKAITFHEDFCSFSNVCSSWRLAIRDLDSSEKLPSRYPSMLVVDDSNQQFQIHLMDGTVRKVPLPNTKSPNSKVRCFSSTGGWILIIEDNTTSATLFHPFSSRQIQLPDMNSLPDADVGEGFWGNRTLVCKVLLSVDPAMEEKDDDLIVMVICGYRGCLGFCRPRDSNWTGVQQGWISGVDDLCYYNGKAYTFDARGEILACDLHPKTPPEMQQFSKTSLVEFGGVKAIGHSNILYILPRNHKKQLLAVYHQIDESPYSEEELERLGDFKVVDVFFVTKYILVFACDLETGEWSKVENLGNEVVFVGLSSSFIMEASGCIKPNCIYFTDHGCNVDFTGDGENVGRLDMGVYDLTNGTIEPHFGVQSLSLNNNPMWIAPPNSILHSK